MRSILLAVLLASPAGASDMNQGGSSTSGTISTGAVTTAALTGNGQITSPLGVDSSSVPVFSAGRNLVLPYGLSFSTGSATYIQLTSATFTGGTGISLQAASGVGTSGQSFMNLTLAGYGPTSGTVQWIGNTGNVLAYWASATHRFYVNATGGGVMDVTSSGITVTGTITGSLSGNATTATALAANGANCSAGQSPLGVDASGAVEGCFTPAGAGDVTLAGTQEFTGAKTFGTAVLTLSSTTVRAFKTATSADPEQDSFYSEFAPSVWQSDSGAAGTVRYRFFGKSKTGSNSATAKLVLRVAPTFTASTNGGAGGDFFAWTQAGFYGVGTSTPMARLHVSSGTLLVDGTDASINFFSSFTLTNTGVASALSNPFTTNRIHSQNITSGAYTKVFMDEDGSDASDNRGGLWGGSTSSGTYTVPTDAAGRYRLEFSVDVAGLSAWIVRFAKNGSEVRACRIDTPAGTVNTINCLRTVKLAAGDTIEVYVYHDGAQTTIGGGGSRTDTFTMKKDDM